MRGSVHSPPLRVTSYPAFRPLEINPRDRDDLKVSVDLHHERVFETVFRRDFPKFMYNDDAILDLRLAPVCKVHDHVLLLRGELAEPTW